MGAILGKICRVKRRLGRWSGLLAAVLVLLMLARADQRMKQAPHAGFLAPGAGWSVTAPDFPAFLDGLARTGAAEALREVWPEPLSKAALWVRLETGIRPTPARWRVWMGRALLAGELDGAPGLCVKPGVAARAAHWANRLAGGVVDGPVCRYGRFFYAWRDGYLIISTDSAYVRATLHAPSVDWPAGLDAGAVRAHWPESGGATLTVRGGAGIPFAGSVPWEAAPARRVAGGGGAWPEDPLLAVTVSDAAHLRLLAHHVSGAVTRVPGLARTGLLPVTAALLTRALDAWGVHTLTGDWAADAGACGLALFPGAAPAPVPLPEAALILHGRRHADAAHPLAVLDRDGLARPYAWHGLEGTVVPWLGPEIALCLLGTDRGWLATTNPDLMARLAGAAWPGGVMRADLAAEADWASVGGLAQALIRYAAQHGLIPGMDTRDAEGRLLPAAQAVAGMGRFRLDGRAVDGRLEFQGLLALERAP